MATVDVINSCLDSIRQVAQAFRSRIPSVLCLFMILRNDSVGLCNDHDFNFS